MDYVFPGDPLGGPRLVPAALRLLLCFWLVMAISQGLGYLVKSALSRVVAVWMGLFSLIYAVSFSAGVSLAGVFYTYVQYIFWALVFWTATAMSAQGQLKLNQLRTLGAFLSCAPLAYFGWLAFTGRLNTAIIESLDDPLGKNVTNFGYTLIFPLPLTLMYAERRRVPGSILAGLTLAACAMTGKRGALVAAVLGLLMYGLMKWRLDRRARRWLARAGVLIFVLMALLVVRNLSAFGQRWVELADTETGGSHRALIYRVLGEYWLQSSPTKQLLGNGFAAVRRITGETYGKSIMAHSDWLEVLLDYGLLGVVLLGSLYGTVLWLMVRLYQQRHFAAPYVACAGTIAVCISFYSMSLQGYSIAWLWLVLGLGAGQEVVLARGETATKRSPQKMATIGTRKVQPHVWRHRHV